MNKNARNSQPLNQITYEATSLSQAKGIEQRTISSALSVISLNDASIIKKKKKPPIDFYSMFSKAIMQNEDQLLNQKKCIEEIAKAKIEEEQKQPHKAKKTGKATKTKTASVQQLDQQIQNDVLSSKSKNEKAFGTLAFNSNEPQNINANNNNKPLEEKSEDKELKEYQKKKLKEKRRRALQSALVYLESNSISFSEFITFNPFQESPYALKYSNRFINAVKFGQYELVKSALQMNIHFLFSYDYYKQTGYHWASKLGNYKILNLLLLNGPYCNQYDYQNRTPLYLAALNNHYECCRLLLSNHGNPFLHDINNKKPVDVSTDNEIYILLSNCMDNPYSNPVMKKRMSKTIKGLELKKANGPNENISIKVITLNDEDTENE